MWNFHAHVWDFKLWQIIELKDTAYNNYLILLKSFFDWVTLARLQAWIKPLNSILNWVIKLNLHFVSF